MTQTFCLLLSFFFSPSNTLLETRIFINNDGKHVERRPGNLVVKYGRHVKASEREALAYAGSLNLRVPRLHDDLPNLNTGTRTDEHGDSGICIWMDYVDGDILQDVWPSMTAEQKLDIAIQLRDILSTMRQQTSTTGMIEACGGETLSDRRVYNSLRGGPFADEAAFNSWQIESLFQATPTLVRDAVARGLNQCSSHHRIVFTHGDLVPHNIIVKDNRILALIDWEYAGWYPEHWELVKFLSGATPYRDWLNLAEHIFPGQYPDEIVAFEAMRRWQNPF